MNEIIHIGFSKTASTWFREFYYPKVKNISYVDKTVIRKRIIEINSFDFDPKVAREFFKSNFNGRLFLSHENLVGPLNSGGFNGLATKEIGMRLKSVFPEGRIIIFIRNQEDIITAGYLQEVWSGSNHGINDFLYRNGSLYDKMMTFSFNYFEYDKIINFYRELFGANKVHVFLYEDFLNDRSGFLKEFEKIFDLEIEPGNIYSKKYNERLRKGLTPLVKIANLFTRRNTYFKYRLFHIPYWFRFSRKMFRYLNSFKIFGNFPTPLSVLGRSNLDYIREYYRESNKKLCDNLGITGIKKYNYPL